MKQQKYTVKGLCSEERSEVVLRTLNTVIPEAYAASCNIEDSSLTFSIKFDKRTQHDAEQRLGGALAALGFELILPANVNTYAYVGDKPKKTRMIPTAVAVSLIAAFMALTLLFTFAACDLFSVGSSGQQGNLGGVTEIHIDGANLPDYVEDLVKLDEIFKMYSYDGIDQEAMGAAMLKAYIAATGDVYAEYMTAEEFDSYNSESAGEFVGIGVSIVNSTVEINGYTYKVMEIISVFADSPAQENGVRVGDCIMYVGGGEERTLVDVLGYTEALNTMLGEAGTKAEFTVFRPDKTQEIGYKEINFSIERRKVITESVNYRISETDSRVGIVNITGFDQTTAPQFCEAVDALLAEGCEYFVFDVRNNPGGALASIEAVLSYFLDEGDLIVSTEAADGSKQEDYVAVRNYGAQYEGYNVKRSDIGKYKGLKSIVLVNQNSASAAELFTATFRDYGLAEIVGMTTYGKGCMQTIIPLERYGLEGGLRVTTAMYFSKSHTVYHGTGIVPDHTVELSEEALEYNFFLLPEALDDQLLTAIDLLTK
ncbi:MAG: PDZ domain-containing protein [Clostridia bacterium]|nr:PDZ domain-containing protein [Clostridia bacterium]